MVFMESSQGPSGKAAIAAAGGGFVGRKYIQSPPSASAALSPSQEGAAVTPFQAVVLSLVQAVTEFLPISSSGHLILVPYFLGWPDQGLSFDVAAHLGTTVAVVAYFRRDLWDLITGFFSGAPGHYDFVPRRLGWALVVGTIPAALAGLALESTISTHLRSPLLIAGTTFVYALFLLWADRAGSQQRDLASLGLRDALLIGLAQALALVPGTSRSGITITAALLLGFVRPAAARFAFLLFIPVGILAGGHDLLKLWRTGELGNQLTPILIAILVSGAVGYLVIGWLLGWLRSRPLTVFVVYRIALAAVIVATLLARQM
jgi:undecaprenyl-diphosphatase